MYFMPHIYSNNHNLARAFLVRGLMSYGAAPFMLSLLQLLIRKFYHPKLFVMIYILWLGNLASAIVLCLNDFHGIRASEDVVDVMDIVCISVLSVFLGIEGIFVGRTYRKLMKEEAAFIGCSPSVFQDT